MLPAHICFASSAHINALLVDELGMKAMAADGMPAALLPMFGAGVDVRFGGLLLITLVVWMLAAPMVAALTRLDALRRSFRAIDLAALGLWALGVDLGVLLAGFALPPGS